MGMMVGLEEANTEAHMNKKRRIDEEPVDAAMVQKDAVDAAAQVPLPAESSEEAAAAADRAREAEQQPGQSSSSSSGGVGAEAVAPPPAAEEPPRKSRRVRAHVVVSFAWALQILGLDAQVHRRHIFALIAVRRMMRAS